MFSDSKTPKIIKIRNVEAEKSRINGPHFFALEEQRRARALSPRPPASAPVDAAHAKLKKMDLEFAMRLGGNREDPHFAHNSWRRLAASTAQAALTAQKCSKEDVELHMGWQLRKHAKEMRLHYAERGARACRARMTEMI